MRIKPFRAVRPAEGQAAAVASPPYDVVSTQEAREICNSSPHSFMHVIRPEAVMEGISSPYDDAVYEQAAGHYRKLKDEGILVRDDKPRLYLYAQTEGDHTQVGLVALCHVEDYEHNLIKKHENTRRDKEDDRTRHVHTLNANAGPVFMMYRDEPALQKLTDEVMTQPPLYEVTNTAGVLHRVWPLDDTAPWLQAFDSVPEIYVADGHHRSASAARVAQERRTANPAHDGTESYNWFLTVLFPASHIHILAYNRVVKGLNGLSRDAFLKAVSSTFKMSATKRPIPDEAGTFCMYIDGQWYTCTLRGPLPQDPVERLDVSLVHKYILEDILGITDIRHDPRITFVGGIKGAAGLEAPVDTNEADVAISMYPVSSEEIMSIADSHQIMPPKVTWFEPKLMSGLLVNELD